MPKFGIDISAYQSNIKLSQAKNEGVEFVIIRAGYTGSFDGISKSKDKQFENHYKNARELGLGVGAYWFSRATTYEAGKLEAEYLYNNCLKDKLFEYPIYIDVEDTKYQAKAGKKQVTNAIKGFCEYLENKGYYVGIYANSNWFKNHIDTASLSMYDKWLACWSKDRPSEPAHGLWQFGGETNKIRTNKIAGLVVDQNYAYKDYPAIIKSNGLNGYKKIIYIEDSCEPLNKSNEELAKEVISGKWGNGQDRVNRLTKAGYIYSKIQSIVNELLSGKKESSKKIYIVQAGDTLSGIAKKYNTTYQKIAADNKIKDPDLIFAGQKLVIK